jgi:hypothetical protein
LRRPADPDRTSALIDPLVAPGVPFTLSARSGQDPYRGTLVDGDKASMSGETTMLKHVLLAGALALVGSPAIADPDKNESGHGAYREWDRHDDRRDRDRDWLDRDRDRRGYSARRVPAGHLPPPGSCRVWFPDRPAGHQPPPMSCREARRYAYRHGGRVIRN